MFAAMRTRSVEMLLATVMTVQGGIFLAPGDTLLFPHYHDLRQWVEVFPGNERTFGAIVMALGLLRWTALIINGYWRRTPAIRIAGCIVGSLWWTSLTLTFVFAPFQALPAALAWTIPAVAFECFSAVRAAIDAHMADSFGLRARGRHVRGRG